MEKNNKSQVYLKIHGQINYIYKLEGLIYNPLLYKLSNPHSTGYEQ
jgi:hypothetical protein